MNTTNLITDYIISGVLGILAFIVPLFMIDQNLFKSIIYTEIKNETAITVGITIIAYSFGVLYNQLADYLEDLFLNLFKIDIVKKSENEVLTKTQLDHHYALQLIVAKSETAYDYISFRRTMIRIVRSVLCLTILIPLLHVIFSIAYRLFSKPLNFSLCNLIVIIVCFLLTFGITYVLKKLYKGYYAAITNFALILKPTP
jgi:hypothetical protein